MKKKKDGRGRKPLAHNLKRFQIRFTATNGSVEKNGGEELLIGKIKKHFKLD